jgi:hypothetical protein
MVGQAGRRVSLVCIQPEFGPCMTCVRSDHAGRACTRKSRPTATVQDFLERYEVGDTVGVGGELAQGMAAAPPARSRRGDLRAAGRAGVARSKPRRRPPTAPRPAPLPCTGFAVVKRGRDKTTGETVAIKVRSCTLQQPSLWGGSGLRRPALRWFPRIPHGGPAAAGAARAHGSCGTCAPPPRLCPPTPPARPPTGPSPPGPSCQVVDKSRYAAGDNSLEREIQVLCKVSPGGDGRVVPRPGRVPRCFVGGGSGRSAHGSAHHAAAADAAALAAHPCSEAARTRAHAAAFSGHPQPAAHRPWPASSRARRRWTTPIASSSMQCTSHSGRSTS